jgi:hypothetical protein
MKLDVTVCTNAIDLIAEREDEDLSSDTYELLFNEKKITHSVKDM